MVLGNKCSACQRRPWLLLGADGSLGGASRRVHHEGDRPASTSGGNYQSSVPQPCSQRDTRVHSALTLPAALERASGVAVASHWLQSFHLVHICTQGVLSR